MYLTPTAAYNKSTIIRNAITPESVGGGGYS